MRHEGQAGTTKKNLPRTQTSMSPGEPDDTRSQPSATTIEAVQNTKRQYIEAMPIVVSYPATIARVQQVARAGEVVFVTTRWLKGRMAVSCEQTTLNAYAVRDEFLSVTTEREALNFVRATGEFLPLGDEISWPIFQLWQRLAKFVHERATLSAAHKATMLEEQPPPSKKLDNAQRLARIELENIQRLLAGTLTPISDLHPLRRQRNF